MLLSGDTATGDHPEWQEQRGLSEAESTARGWQPMMRVPGWDPAAEFEAGSKLPKGKRVPPTSTVGAHPEQASPLKKSLEDQEALSKLNNMGKRSSLTHQASAHLPSLQAPLAKAEIKQNPTLS